MIRRGAAHRAKAKNDGVKFFYGFPSSVFIFRNSKKILRFFVVEFRIKDAKKRYKCQEGWKLEGYMRYPVLSLEKDSAVGRYAG
jgi:hypothetical protein